MAISEQKTVTLNSKAISFVGYLGTLAENAQWGNSALTHANLQIVYGAELDGNPIDSVFEGKVNLTLAQIEQDFPGIVQQLTAIADHYNPYK